MVLELPASLRALIIVLTHKEENLRRIVRGLRRLIVAYSGGVDSALLTAVAYQELGDDILAVTASSPSVAQGEFEAARAQASAIGVRHEVIETREFANPRYLRNAKDRCYYCKEELFSRLIGLARERSYDHVADGFNADDGRAPLDRRPGHQAGLRLGVCSPLAQAELGKEEIRNIAQRLRLKVWEKPATPCLSSRVPYGTAIEIDTLRKVDLAEQYLRAIGYDIVRVRHFGDVARVEVPLDRVEQLRAAASKISNALGSIGYDRIEIDPRGYRMGSLNEV